VPWAGNRRLRLAMALLIALAAPAARADYKESFRKGIEAVDRGEWSEAARWMRQAAAEQGAEGEKVKLYGVRFEPYLPHYYLGLALFQAGDCEGALAAWQKSESQGAVQQTSRYKTLQQNGAACRLRLAAKAPPPTPAPSGPDPVQVAREAEARRAAEAQALRDKELQAQKEREQREQTEKEQKEQKEREERDRTERIARDQREAEDRRQQEDAAAQVAAQAETARQEAENRERARRQELTREIGRAVQDASPLLDRAGKAPSPDAELKRRQAALRDLLRKAGAAGDATSVADLERLSREISSTASRLEATLLKAEGATGPPAEIRAAARAYLRGDYQEVVRSLGAARFTEPRATMTAHLLLGAARYALYAQGGKKDAGLRAQAIENLRTCHRLSPALVPDPKVFSPRFVAFYKAAG
jgi:hypothetical protein